MDLPNFITKALAFFGVQEAANTRIEQKVNTLAAAEQQLAEARTKLTAAETELTTERQTIKTAQDALKKEQTDHATTKTALQAAEAKLADPTGEIQRVAAMKANEIAVRMGAPPIKAENQTEAANGGKTLLDQYLELNLKDPKAAAQFAAQHGGAVGLMSGK